MSYGIDSWFFTNIAIWGPNVQASRQFRNPWNTWNNNLKHDRFSAKHVCEALSSCEQKNVVNALAEPTNHKTYGTHGHMEPNEHIGPVDPVEPTRPVGPKGPQESAQRVEPREPPNLGII